MSQQRQPRVLCKYCAKMIYSHVFVDHFFNCRETYKGEKKPELTEEQKKELLVRKFHLNWEDE